MVDKKEHKPNTDIDLDDADDPTPPDNDVSEESIDTLLDGLPGGSNAGSAETGTISQEDIDNLLSEDGPDNIPDTDETDRVSQDDIDNLLKDDHLDTLAEENPDSA